MENNKEDVDDPFTGPWSSLKEGYEKWVKALDDAELPLRQLERKVALGMIQEDKRDQVIKNRRSVIAILERYHEILGRSLDQLGRLFIIVPEQGLKYPTDGVEYLKQLRRLMLVDIEVLKKEDEQRKEENVKI